jgi:hypothetical protein
MRRVVPTILIGPSLLFFLISANAVHADVITQVQATGYTAVANGDIGSAYEQAKRAALREAVEQATGILVSARSLTQNFSLIEDQISTHTKGYIRSYTVSDHGQDKQYGVSCRTRCGS